MTRVGVVHKACSNDFQYVGEAGDCASYILQPEEILFLMQKSKLDLKMPEDVAAVASPPNDECRSISLKAAFDLFCESACVVKMSHYHVYAYLRNRGFIVWRPSSSYVAKFARSFQNFAGFELISFVGFKPDAKFAKCSQRLPDFLFLVIDEEADPFEFSAKASSLVFEGEEENTFEVVICAWNEGIISFNRLTCHTEKKCSNAKSVKILL